MSNERKDEAIVKALRETWNAAIDAALAECASVCKTYTGTVGNAAAAACSDAIRGLKRNGD